MLTITINTITLIFGLTLIICLVAAGFTAGAVRSFWRTRDLISAILVGLTSMVLLGELWSLLAQAAQLGDLAGFLAWLDTLRWLRLADRLYKVVVLGLIIYGFKIIKEREGDHDC